MFFDNKKIFQTKHQISVQTNKQYRKERERGHLVKRRQKAELSNRCQTARLFQLKRISLDFTVQMKF